MLWAECASTATKLSNSILRKNRKSAHLDFYGEDPGYTKEIRNFGEIGTKLTKLNEPPDKQSNKGTHCFSCGI
jgi:hypothetical protein